MKQTYATITCVASNINGLIGSTQDLHQIVDLDCGKFQGTLPVGKNIATTLRQVRIDLRQYGCDIVDITITDETGKTVNATKTEANRIAQYVHDYTNANTYQSRKNASKSTTCTSKYIKQLEIHYNHNNSKRTNDCVDVYTGERFNAKEKPNFKLQGYRHLNGCVVQEDTVIDLFPYSIAYFLSKG